MNGEYGVKLCYLSRELPRERKKSYIRQRLLSADAVAGMAGIRFI